MAIYNNEQKAVIYGSASQTIRDVLIQSDYKQANGDWRVDTQTPAICLHAEVSELIRKVNNHITLLDPKNVVDQLKGVAASVQQKQTTAVNKQADAQAAQKKAKDAPAEVAAQANRDAIKATNEANAANAEAKKAQDENTVQSVAAAANDFSDLQKLPTLEDRLDLQAYCFPPAAKQVPAPSASPSATPMPGAG
jgi:hypothetical protein